MMSFIKNKKIAYITYLHNTPRILQHEQVEQPFCHVILATWHSYERNVTLNYYTNEGHV
jgi:hypothetical protein